MCKQSSFFKPSLRIAGDISLHYRVYILQHFLRSILIDVVMMEIPPSPFEIHKTPSVFLFIIYVSVKDSIYLCVIVYGCTDDFTPDLAVFSSCEYSQYSGIELRSPGCNAVRVMNLMTSQQPDLKAHAWQKSVAAYPSKPGHLFLLILTFIAANTVLEGGPKRLFTSFPAWTNYWLVQEGPYRSRKKDCSLVKCRHVAVCKHMTVNVFVIFHIDSNFPLWKIKGKSTSSGHSDKRACSGPLALGNGEVSSCASVLHSNRVHDKCLCCRDLSVLQNIKNIYKKRKKKCKCWVWSRNMLVVGLDIIQ